MDDAPQRKEEDERNESGLPGGGIGRRDETGKSGVYPASASQGASGEAQVHGEAGWGQGERGAAGYEDSGDSEIIPPDIMQRATERDETEDDLARGDEE
jgi:hypothetical protein